MQTKKCCFGMKSGCIFKKIDGFDLNKRLFNAFVFVKANGSIGLN